jgi:hypothetical protein
MRIQYASDLHIELWQKNTFDETLEPTAPYLVLCGDIATLDSPNLRSFLEYVSERWKYVFYIPGNSEIWSYSNSEEVSLNKLRELCSPYRNIKLLYKSSFLLKEDDEKMLVVGVSLWHKPRNNSMLHYHNKIYVKAIKAPVDEKIFALAHKSQLEYLTYVVKNSNYPLLICSYYAPFTWCYEEDWLQEPSSAVIDQEVEKLITYPIVSWITAHCHHPIEYTRRYFLTTGYDGVVLFVSNPRGKPKENPYYRTEAVLNVKPNMLEGFEKKDEEQIPYWAKR